MAVIMQYKHGKSALHRVDAGIKLIFLLVLALLSVILPERLTLAGMILCAALAFRCGWTPAELAADLKPALYYTVLLVSAPALSALTAADSLSIQTARAVLAGVDGWYILRLIFVLQASALFFRTTSSLAIKNALSDTEIRVRLALRKLPFSACISPQARFGVTIALTLSFIPEVFALWSQLERAWRARGGGKGMRKLRVLLFSLLALSFHTAAQKAKALAAREVL